MQVRTALSARKAAALRTAPLLAPVVLLLVLGWQRRWMAEDAFHYLRVAEQILAGNGPVFNVGERVDLATSTLWVWLLSGLLALLPFVRGEWIAVCAGLVLSVLGLWWAQRGAIALWASDTATLSLPLGAWLMAALSISWDWSTSGMENGLSMAWMGALMMYLARIATRAQPKRKMDASAIGLLIGIGPLVRPDFAVLSAITLAAVLWIRRPDFVAGLRQIAWAALLPAAFQIFRTGYYGSLVPNTAIAKDSGGQYWAQGWSYLLDLVVPYWLVVPLVGLGIAAWRLSRNASRDRVVVMLAFLLGGLVHALYLTRSGGDYLSGRVILRSLFAIIVPLAAVPRRRSLALPIGIVSIWALVAAGGLRSETLGDNGVLTTYGLADGRALMAHLSPTGRAPVLATDFGFEDGPLARRLQAEGERALVFPHRVEMDATIDRTTLTPKLSGVSGFLAGTEVRVHPTLPLSNPVAARMPAMPRPERRLS